MRIAHSIRPKAKTIPMRVAISTQVFLLGARVSNQKQKSSSCNCWTVAKKISRIKKARRMPNILFTA
jgi:hypothetical protein